MKQGSMQPITRVPWTQLQEAAAVTERAVDLTHALYRYPASMSPTLARALILGLTVPGDTVADPFCGGGTTAIEALAHGRGALCSDINTLACFVTQAKAHGLSTRAMGVYEAWVAEIKSRLANEVTRAQLSARQPNDFLYGPRTHALIIGLRDSAGRISEATARRFATLVVLRVAQLSYDRTSRRLHPDTVTSLFGVVAGQASAKMRQYIEECNSVASQRYAPPMLRVLNCDAEELARRLTDSGPQISLVLTSPPYPGVHMLYHRWQIRGRRETALPYELIGQADGRYESAYTLGSRQEANNAKYFDRLEAVYKSLRCVLQPQTWVAQVVAFSRPRRQLQQLRDIMVSAGFDEVVNPELAGRPEARRIPNRRWYAVLSGNQNSSREYLLIHRPRRP